MYTKLSSVQFFVLSTGIVRVQIYVDVYKIVSVHKSKSM
jgi:hypothetical protein